ncbi:DUF4242 domain-containing protein [Salisediminibacterium selenitireducens]|uniref:DUF4242 domain-containing protein n=1 Tax=Bacillus selenitireducens (strain ATCC 700615 / DSM 15326 / MLS10) TaxID=439292 RepID=D6XYC6_BACIE|nr:DUF4242 domain-containing protein [Salisediminibacterium selenitireducens]ADI00195.1 hypothetical protein Bsel_2697 [[Bacillus] selenitireducens MLS10]
MGLYLFESALQDSIRDEAAVSQAVERFETAKGSHELIEVQVAQNFQRAFLIVETDQESDAKEALEASGFPVSLAKEVRIVGQDLEHVKAQKEKINYLVEWNLPENLTMDQYLERKKKNSVHYQEVPEVSFSRTYVCEDMTKCLCFYDAPDDEAVVRAREAVKAPIDAITELNPNKK